MLSSVLEKFQEMKVCRGLGDINISFIQADVKDVGNFKQSKISHDANKKTQIASMQDAFLNKKFMLCMLTNIRSVGYYEFLRKNNIFSCMRTICSYFSLINAKCDFDKHFAKLLEKYFASKTSLQRHGVLLLNKINIRKSITVCSKNLTYLRLMDLDDDWQQSIDINEQTTHGLVLIFQLLVDDTQIAVFAKNSVKGEELTKIIVKAIPYLEQCGAMIHGVADGAGTNMKM
ncbi:hypothetical protein ACFW04_008649 [Cataglyphis niger]